MSYNRWLTQPDELYHYGVLGMKWGVHKVHSAAKGINKTDKSDDPAVLNRAHEKYLGAQKSLYLKSRRKLDRYDRRYQKLQAKADRKYDKAERKANSLFSSKKSADRAFRKAAKAQFKANKVAARGKRWYEQMIKAYKSANIKMNDSTQKIGEEFIRQVRANSRAMYAASYAGGR